MLKPLWCAVGFLTCLPTPTQHYSDEEVARSAGFFAWVGLLLSAVSYILMAALEGLGPRLVALLIVILSTAITGALHLDGVADTADGFSGGRGDRKRILDIMRDSRIGAHGATALILTLFLHVSLLEELLEARDGRLLWAPVLARLSSTLLLWRFPYARSSGLGSAFEGRVGPAEVGLGALALLPPFVLVSPAWLAGVVALALPYGFATLVSVRLGGLTGDIHGAAVELSELACLGTLVLV